MPYEGYADPVTNDGSRFHSDMPVSELTERDTRAIEASVVSSTPPVAETVDGVMHKTESLVSPMGLEGSSRPTPTRESDRPRFEGRPTKGSRPPRIKQS